MKSLFRSRLSILSLSFLFFALFLVGRLYFLQVVYGREYSERADRQYVRPTETLFSRGTIFFSNKDESYTSAATLESGFTVAINPMTLENLEETFSTLSSSLPLSREDFFARAEKKNDPYEEIARRVPEVEAHKIEDFHLPGVLIFKERWRFYPGESLAAHILGFVGSDGDTLAGRYGLERYYEDVLRRAGGNLYVNFFAEIFANVKEKLVDKKESEGDIVTTIEPSVQSFLEEVLEDISKTWAPDQIGGIIINPQNGEIYALGAYPSFNPNSFQNDSLSLFGNSLIENVYEMGSIVKPLTIAAALDAGAIIPQTTYEDKGFLILNNAKISNYDGKAHGVVDMQTVLSLSLNTGAAFAALKMGKEDFAKYMKNFRVGDETGIDLPNETFGLMDNLKSTRDIEYATASFGQGIAFTPIATVRALSTLGNGGFLIDPHIVKKIEYRSGLSKNIAGQKGEQVLKTATSEEITRMLVKVVDEALLGGTVKLPRYSIAAKTGTAQVAKKEGGGYDENKFLHSFFGYFPAYDPEFLVFLFAMNPKGVRFASETLTHPFIDIAKFLINYYEIPPDR